MKPIVRWTIGNTLKQQSYDCLRLSIQMFKKHYRNKFELFVCYNNVDVNKLKKLSNDINLIDQTKHEKSINILPSSNGWKLYPPRLNLNSHEIFIDNDLIITSPLEEIDLFLLKKDLFLTTQSYKRSYSLFENEIKSDFNINSGIIGLPPYFNFKNEIEFFIKGCDWSSYFNEQSIVAMILQNKNVLIIDLDKIRIAYEDDYYKKGKNGVHFVGLNNKQTSHWNNFLNFL